MSKKLTIDEMQTLAELRGGKCLSTKYLNLKSQLNWQCVFGHCWWASANNIKHGNHWCPECSKNKKLTIFEMQRIALIKGGKCLSKKYINNSTKLLWQCKDGHEWEAVPNAIRIHNTWCPECANRKKLTIEIAQDIANKKGGICVSKSCDSNKSRLKWKCKYGHLWIATLDKVKNQGSWCPKCSGNTRLNIEDMQALAKKRGGKCLSSNYINNSNNLLWECKFGHQWSAIAGNIKKGKWCPECAGSRGELITRRFFENIFQKAFPKSRPPWLKVGSNRLELDGFCYELGLAFEYQGNYHFSKKHFWFSKNEQDFRHRQKLDGIKRNLCAENKVILLEIPEVDPAISWDIYKSTIRTVLEMNNISVPEDYDSIQFSCLDAYCPTNYFEYASFLAKEKNGVCLTTNILYTSKKIEWECERKHRWLASLNVVKKGHWCMKCAGKERGTLEEMQAIAIGKGGKCLSTKYINAHTKLVWECKMGHQWRAMPLSIKNNNSWCLTCSGSKKLSIDIFHQIAALRNGKCLSGAYFNNREKLIFECQNGHVWKAAPVKIKNGKTWCPQCSRQKLVL